VILYINLPVVYFCFYEVAYCKSPDAELHLAYLIHTLANTRAEIVANVFETEMRHYKIKTFEQKVEMKPILKHVETKHKTFETMMFTKCQKFF